MKKLTLFVLVILTLASCSSEFYQCHAYGGTNRTTKQGNKAQAHYMKHKHRI